MNSEVYSRRDMGFQAVCVGYMLCKKFGVDTKNFAIDRIPEELAKKEPKEIRAELVALSQVGNVGGEQYWSWYGFGSRVEWCACFVSWCANECGYIDTGIIPKYAGCVNGVQWFKDRGQWIDGSAEPVPGMIIFFDWDNKGSSGPQDGQSDHTGIVEKVENGIVYTVEGNSGDSCRINQYSVGHYEILGYGVPQY